MRNDHSSNYALLSAKRLRLSKNAPSCDLSISCLHPCSKLMLLVVWH